MNKNDLRVNSVYSYCLMTVIIKAVNSQSIQVINVDTGQMYFLDPSIALLRIKEL